jgi:hypothetical protein
MNQNCQIRLVVQRIQFLGQGCTKSQRVIACNAWGQICRCSGRMKKNDWVNEDPM